MKPFPVESTRKVYNFKQNKNYIQTFKRKIKKNKKNKGTQNKLFQENQIIHHLRLVALL